MFWIFILNTLWFIGCNLVVSILFGLVCLALASRKLVNTTELARDRSVTMITCGASLHSVETTDKKFLLGINSFDLQFVCWLFVSNLVFPTHWRIPTLAMLGTCPLWRDLFANFNLMWYTWISVNLVNVGKNLQLLWEISGMFHPLPDDVLEPLASVQPPLPLMCPWQAWHPMDFFERCLLSRIRKLWHILWQQTWPRP